MHLPSVPLLIFFTFQPYFLKGTRRRIEKTLFKQSHVIFERHGSKILMWLNLTPSKKPLSISLRGF